MNHLKHIKFVKRITATCFLIVAMCIPSSSCTSVSNQSSIEKFNCKDPKSQIKLIPGTPRIVMAPTFCDDYVFNPKKVQTVITMFVREYAAEFNIPEHVLWRHLSGLKIETSLIGRKVPLAYSSQGKLLKNVDVTGLALTKKHIWVEVLTKQINMSAFIHELVHIIIWHENYGVHGDPDHEGSEFSGWTSQHTKFIKRMNIQLLEMGI